MNREFRCFELVTQATGLPADASRRRRMICSSVNRFFISNFRGNLRAYRKRHGLANSTLVMYPHEELPAADGGCWSLPASVRCISRKPCSMHTTSIGGCHGESSISSSKCKRRTAAVHGAGHSSCSTAYACRQAKSRFPP